MSVVLRVYSRSKAALGFIEFIKTLPLVKVVEPVKKPNAETIKAIEDVENGKTEKLTLSEFRKQLYG